MGEKAVYPALEERLTRSLAAIQLSARARERIWQKARRRASEMMSTSRRGARRWMWYPAMAAVMLLAFLGGYVGVVSASGAPVPGDPWYVVERGAEVVWMTLTPTGRRDEVRLVLLQRRIDEVRALLDAGRSVPPDLLQEVEMLFGAVVECAPNCGAPRAEMSRALEDYRDALADLNVRYPGVLGLEPALEAANKAVAYFDRE